MSDSRLVDRIRELLVVPYAIERLWDYSEPDQRFLCWTVLEHVPSNEGIAFCSEGFGCPWGVVSLSGPDMSMGMDAQWFRSLEGAMRECMAWDGPNPAGYESR